MYFIEYTTGEGEEKVENMIEVLTICLKKVQCELSPSPPPKKSPPHPLKKKRKMCFIAPVLKCIMIMKIEQK